MLLPLFFSSTSLYSVVGVSTAIMILLTFLYRGDRKQRRVFFLAWSVFFIVLLAGSLSVRLEAIHAERRVHRMLNETADHLIAALQILYPTIPPEISPNDPRYREIMSLLSIWQNDVTNVAAFFTLCKNNDGHYHYILSPTFEENRDGTLSDPLEKTEPPGTDYAIRDPKAIQDIEAAFRDESVISMVPYRDNWGFWITVFRPLKDDNGNVVSVFGINYWGDAWNRSILRARMWPSLFFYSFLLFFFLQLLYILKQRSEEENLRYYSRELERMVGATDEIQKQLNWANQNKRVFLENMYEELKAKCDQCFNHIDDLKTRCLGESPGLLLETGNALQEVHEGCVDFLSSLDLIYSYLQTNTKKEASRQELFPIRSYLNNLRSNVLHQLSKKPGLSFQLVIEDHIPAEIMVDHVRLGAIVLELMNHAINSSENGTIRLDVSFREFSPDQDGANSSSRDSHALAALSGVSGEWFFYEEEPPLFEQLSYVKISLTDAARKIPANKRSRFFHPFYHRRGESNKTDMSYFGYGLCRLHTRIAGGTLRLVDPDGPGNTFVLLIPAAIPGFVQPVQGPDAGAMIPPRPLKGFRILIVDASIANQIFVETLLNNAGAQTEITGSGFEAVHLLLEERLAGRFFDLIVMDIHMPQMDGYETAERIRNQGFMRPIIFTGVAFGNRSLRGGESDVVVAKPVDRQLLIQTILRLTDGKRHARKWRIRHLERR